MRETPAQNEKGRARLLPRPLRLSLMPCVGPRASRSVDAWEYLPNFPPFRRLPRRLLLHGHFTKMLTSQLEESGILHARDSKRKNDNK